LGMALKGGSSCSYYADITLLEEAAPSYLLCLFGPEMEAVGGSGVLS